MQDRDGARAALPAGVVTLDGAPHALTVAVPRDVQVVAVDARLTAAGAVDSDQQSQAPFVIDVMLRDATLSPGGSWTAARPPTTEPVAASLDDIKAAAVAGGVRLTLAGTALLPGAVVDRRRPDRARVPPRRRRARRGLRDGWPTSWVSRSETACSSRSV